MDAKAGIRSLIAAVLVLGLALEHARQVEARTCCSSSMARNLYNTCRFHGRPQAYCAKVSGCKIVDGKCDGGYPHARHSLHSSSDEASALEFCKLGCTSSVCDNIKDAIGDQEANDDVVERCDEACSRFCTKHVDTATTTVVSSASA